MMVQAISEVEQGSDVELQFTIPGIGRTIKATGQVIWTKRNPGGNHRVSLGIGVRFKRIDRNELAIIREFVEGKQKSVEAS